MTDVPTLSAQKMAHRMLLEVGWEKNELRFSRCKFDWAVEIDAFAAAAVAQERRRAQEEAVRKDSLHTEPQRAEPDEEVMRRADQSTAKEVVAGITDKMGEGGPWGEFATNVIAELIADVRKTSSTAAPKEGEARSAEKMRLMRDALLCIAMECAPTNTEWTDPAALRRHLWEIAGKALPLPREEKASS